jgi:hypothetical protein
VNKLACLSNKSLIVENQALSLILNFFVKFLQISFVVPLFVEKRVVVCFLGVFLHHDVQVSFGLNALHFLVLVYNFYVDYSLSQSHIILVCEVEAPN